MPTTVDCVWLAAAAWSGRLQYRKKGTGGRTSSAPMWINGWEPAGPISRLGAANHATPGELRATRARADAAAQVGKPPSACESDSGRDVDAMPGREPSKLNSSGQPCGHLRGDAHAARPKRLDDQASVTQSRPGRPCGSGVRLVFNVYHQKGGISEYPHVA